MADAEAADTEYELELEAGIRDFDLFARVTTAVVKYSWIEGDVTKTTDGLFTRIPTGERVGESFIVTGIGCEREPDETEAVCRSVRNHRDRG